MRSGKFKAIDKFMCAIHNILGRYFPFVMAIIIIKYSHRYPDATMEELSSGDNVCIICREEMTEGCKKLPCNHIFHTSCLRNWFQRQQTCPTCRMDILRPPAPRPAPQQANVQPPAAAQPQVPAGKIQTYTWILVNPMSFFLNKSC